MMLLFKQNWMDQSHKYCGMRQSFGESLRCEKSEEQLMSQLRPGVPMQRPIAGFCQSIHCTLDVVDLKVLKAGFRLYC